MPWIFGAADADGMEETQAEIPKTLPKPKTLNP